MFFFLVVWRANCGLFWDSDWIPEMYQELEFLGVSRFESQTTNYPNHQANTMVDPLDFQNDKENELQKVTYDVTRVKHVVFNLKFDWRNRKSPRTQCHEVMPPNP